MPEESAGVATRHGGLIQVATNADIERMEQAERDRRKAEQEQQQPAILSLARTEGRVTVPTSRAALATSLSAACCSW